VELSKQAEYRIAIPAAVDGDYATARVNLEILLARCADESDLGTRGYLLQVLGNIEARDGKIQRGHELHQAALRLDPDSPLPQLLYAKGLLRAFGDPAGAQARLVTLESHLAENPPDEEGMGAAWYREEIALLRREIAAQQAATGPG
jgi:predicted Zn-dependent protease